MRAGIIFFSLSGHTGRIADFLRKSLENKNVIVQVIDITKDENYLEKANLEKTLKNSLKEHDVLFVCAPVYAGHCEHNILELIRRIPDTGGIKKAGIPVITYGGVHSSVALEEMAVEFRKRGYIPIMGIKVAAEHTLTKTFNRILNESPPGEFEKELIKKAVDEIMDTVLEKKPLFDAGKAFKYEKLPKRIMFKIMTQEKIHGKYKKVAVKKDICIGCGNCVNVCPVNMYRLENGKAVMVKPTQRCILCAEYFRACPVEAIYFPYLAVVKKRLGKEKIKMETTQSAIYR